MFLRAIAWPLMAKVKQTTGIVGLDVVPNAREVLIGLYTKTLKEIQAVPEDEGYRKAVESFTRQRLNVFQEEEDWEVIEMRLGCGQVEELIEEAQDELTLIGKMIAWNPWGVSDDHDVKCLRMMHQFLSTFLTIDLLLSLENFSRRWRLFLLNPKKTLLRSAMVNQPQRHDDL